MACAYIEKNIGLIQIFFTKIVMTNKKGHILARSISITLMFNIIPVNADVMGDADSEPEVISIPQLNPGLELNTSLIFFKPGATNLNYVIYNKGLPLQSPSWTEKELSSDYSPGFEVGASYNFPKAVGNNVYIDWTHFNSTTNASVSAPNDQFFLGPDYQIGPDAIPIRNAEGSVNFKYDVINLDAGQFLRFGHHVDMRFFGGLSAGFLKENVTSIYSGNVPTPPL